MVKRNSQGDTENTERKAFNKCDLRKLYLCIRHEFIPWSLGFGHWSFAGKARALLIQHFI
jgi:hypothetical protein